MGSVERGSCSRPSLREGGSRLDLGRGRYTRVYSFAGPPSEVLLQEVRTDVRYVGGGELLVAYRGLYAEWFRLAPDGTVGGAADPAPLHDVHDFDLRRDGWTQDFMLRLLRRHRPEGALRSWRGPVEVECRKTFVLGLGEIEQGVALRRGAGGAEFGFLAAGPSGPAQAQVTLAREGGGERLTLTPPTSHPFGHAGAGRGGFAGAAAWRARETFRYVFATLAGSFSDDRGYLPVELSSARRRSPPSRPG